MLGIVLFLFVYFVSQYLHSVIPTFTKFLLDTLLPCARMHSKVMHSVTLVCMHVYIIKKLAVYCLTAQKSPTEYILLLSH